MFEKRRNLVQRFVNLVIAWTLFDSVLRVDGADPIDSSPPRSTKQAGIAASADAGAKSMLDGPPLESLPNWSETLRAVLLTAIPDKYEDLSHWDQTVDVFDGLQVRQRGFDIRVKERKKAVNHGPWHRYKIEFIDPARHLKVVIDRIRPIGMGQFQFEIRLASKLRCRGDFEHWVLGVKGFNMTVVSEADVQVVAQCQLSIHTEPNPKSLVPNLVLDPRVNAINLSLTNLDVRRIGEIRGDVAEGIGDGSRHFIENLLQAQQGRAVRKANEAIDKNRKRLRISSTLF